MIEAELMDRNGRRNLNIPSVLFQRKRIVFLTGEITDTVAEHIIQQMMMLSLDQNEDITMVINSPGGSVTAGLAIYDTMQGIPCDIATVATGLAASMAAFLLAAGTKGKRTALPHSEIMIHQVLGKASGQADDVEIAARRIGHMKKTINGLLSMHTGQTADRIRKDTDRDCFLTAEEARDYGLIDHVQRKWHLGSYAE